MAPPLELIDDVAAEIFLRLPPDEPEHLFRASLVCKHWLRVISDPDFRRRYRAFHLSFGDGTVLDCRHGRALFRTPDSGWCFMVVDPFTGAKQRLPKVDIKDILICSAVVFCAVSGCDHLYCHGGPFRVVVMVTDDRSRSVKATVYSSETGAWSRPVSLGDDCEVYARHRQDAMEIKFFYLPYVQPRRGAVIGDETYFTLRRENAIIKYNCSKNCISMINPPSHDAYYIALMVMENSQLGFVCIDDSSLYVWSRKVSSEEALEWVKCRVIKLEGLIPVTGPDDKAIVVGSAEGVGVIFVTTGAGLFTFELKSGRVTKVHEPAVYFSILPYMRLWCIIVSDKT